MLLVVLLLGTLLLAGCGSTPNDTMTAVPDNAAAGAERIPDLPNAECTTARIGYDRRLAQL